MDLAEKLFRRSFHYLVENYSDKKRVLGRIVIELERIDLFVFESGTGRRLEVIGVGVPVRVGTETPIKRRKNFQQRGSARGENIEAEIVFFLERFSEPGDRSVSEQVSRTAIESVRRFSRQTSRKKL